MLSQNVELLRSIKTFTQLVKYLRDELDWPIETDNFDDLTFDYEPEELGIDAKTAVKIKDIKQLRPLVSKQPWGIFFINFEPKQLPIVVLRRILRSLVIKKRASSNKSQQAAWKLHDLLFICSLKRCAGLMMEMMLIHGARNGRMPLNCAQERLSLLPGTWQYALPIEKHLARQSKSVFL